MIAPLGTVVVGPSGKASSTCLVRTTISPGSYAGVSGALARANPMASNVAAKQDPADNLKPDKAKSSEKIDGIVAGIMALGRAMVSSGDNASVYDERPSFLQL